MSSKPSRVSRLAGLLVAGLLACTLAHAARGSERSALEAAVDRWTSAVNAQDAATLSSTMTEDVELLDGTSRVTGRKAAVRALCEGDTRGQLVATKREMTIVDDVAWRVAGLAQIRKNGDVHARGQALEIWKRVNGEWRLHRRMVAGIAAPADLLTRPSPDEPVLDRPKN